MRRMYSEQELTKIIGEVFDAKIEAGAFDDSISDAVDAYLVEHPVDITALEGKTIAPAVVNATTSVSAPSGAFNTLNGESNPSVKPIYYHPIFLSGATSTKLVRILFVILDNSPTQYNAETAISKVEQLLDAGAIISVDGIVVDSASNKTSDVYKIEKDEGVYKLFAFNYDNRFEIDLEDVTWSQYQDGVNKIN